MCPADITGATRDFTRGVERDAPIPTWIGVGGRADALLAPATEAELRDAIDAWADRPIRVLGDGANLLVDDDGVDGLVIATERLTEAQWLEDGLLRAQAGANLPRLIVESVRRGLAGLEGLAGVPASLGGAIRMNAGGAFGEIGACVESVRVAKPGDEVRTLTRDEIPFAYRRSGIEGVILSADLRLTPAEHGPLRERLKEVMAKKKASQPLAADSAGCAFKNPTIDGARAAAGRLIDEAGCKGLRIGGAEVSAEHANFIFTHPGATARDVLALMAAVAERVRERFGVELEREVVVWRRGESA
jgi:UDP-N-acetylmuramate dehydrogenase